MLKISLLLGAIAALADVAGGLVLVRARGVERYLRYFVALGAGFLMATAVLEMAPESLRLSPRLGPLLIMAREAPVASGGGEQSFDEFSSDPGGDDEIPF
jgi:ZIP family zinc transporter/zinc and cadmium transporter